jgi:hypothetical protein
MLRRVRRRFLVAVCVSTLLHALVVLATIADIFSLSNPINVPEIELKWAEITLLDPDQLQGAASPPPPPSAPPPVVNPPPKPKGPDPAPKAENPPEKKKKRSFGARGSTIDQLGPSAANFYLLLANRRLRRLPFAEEAVDIMAPMYDFRYLVHGAGFHPLHDFDYIVIASPNLLDITQTFLAVQTRLPRAELIAGLDRASRAEGFKNIWEQRGELMIANPVPAKAGVDDWDPRWFVLTEDDILLYVRPEYLDKIAEGPSKSKGKTAGNFVSKIAKIRRFARREPRAGLQIVVDDISASLRSAKVKGGGELPFGIPDKIEVMVEASSKPRSIVRLEFPNDEDAERAEAFWTDKVKDAIANDMKLKFIVGPLYRATKVEREGGSLTLRNRFGTAQAREVLKILGGVSQKLNGPTKKEVKILREERERLWQLRKEGKQLPSEALAEATDKLPLPSVETNEGTGPNEAATPAAPEDAPAGPDPEAVPSDSPPQPSPEPPAPDPEEGDRESPPPPPPLDPG